MSIANHVIKACKQLRIGETFDGKNQHEIRPIEKLGLQYLHSITIVTERGNKNTKMRSELAIANGN